MVDYYFKKHCTCGALVRTIENFALNDILSYQRFIVSMLYCTRRCQKYVSVSSFVSLKGRDGIIHEPKFLHSASQTDCASCGITSHDMQTVIISDGSVRSSCPPLWTSSWGQVTTESEVGTIYRLWYVVAYRREACCGGWWGWEYYPKGWQNTHKQHLSRSIISWPKLSMRKALNRSGCWEHNPNHKPR